MTQDDMRFDAVLPSHLIFNENIEPSAKLFYAVVRNLCNKYGYCFASNEYLSSLMNVDQRTIRRWLESLCESEYLSTEHEKKGIKTERKIFISDGFQKMFTKGQKCPPPPDKNVRHKEDSIKEDNKPNLTKPSLPKKPIPEKTVEKEEVRSGQVLSEDKEKTKKALLTMKMQEVDIKAGRTELVLFTEEEAHSLALNYSFEKCSQALLYTLERKENARLQRKSPIISVKGVFIDALRNGWKPKRIKN